MSERVIADAFDRWLRSEGILFRRDRMDKATTCMRGWPDFEIIAGGRTLFIELKTEKGSLSRDQQSAHAKFSKAGYTVHVIRDIAAAVELVQQWRSTLGEPREPGMRTTLFGGFRFDVTKNGQLVNKRKP